MTLNQLKVQTGAGVVNVDGNNYSYNQMVLKTGNLRQGTRERPYSILWRSLKRKEVSWVIAAKIPGVITQVIIVGDLNATCSPVYSKSSQNKLCTQVVSSTLWSGYKPTQRPLEVDPGGPTTLRASAGLKCFSLRGGMGWWRRQKIWS